LNGRRGILGIEINFIEKIQRFGLDEEEDFEASTGCYPWGFLFNLLYKVFFSYAKLILKDVSLFWICFFQLLQFIHYYFNTLFCLPGI
jgi:hypothetical protein